MPLPELSRQEVRLGRFAALCSAVHAAAAVLFALFPGWTFTVLGRAGAEQTAEVRFWQVLGVAMMVTVSVACGLVAHSPRERRVALLPVLAGKLTSSAMALSVLAASAPDGWSRLGFRAVVALFAVDLPLFAVSASPDRGSLPRRPVLHCPVRLRGPRRLRHRRREPRTPGRSAPERRAYPVGARAARAAEAGAAHRGRQADLSSRFLTVARGRALHFDA